MEKKKKKRIIIIVIALLIIVRICFMNYRLIINPAQMPDIVFLNIIDYTEVRDDVEYGMTFYDKNGVHYTTRDSDVLGFDFDKLVRDYRAGKLEDKISYHMTCDVDELFENYQKLCTVSGNPLLEIEYPEVSPQVQAVKTTWYGLYYDMFGNVKSVVLHKEDAAGHHYTNNETANEIYEWYMGTFKKQ